MMRMGVVQSFLGQTHIRMGIFFLCVHFFFFLISVVNVVMAVDRKFVNVAVDVIVIINYLVFTNFLIGSQVYLLVLDKYYVPHQ
jgi:hypothetical protein